MYSRSLREQQGSNEKRRRVGVWAPADSDDVRGRSDTEQDGDSFIAGALAGTCADTILHPLDTVNTRIKAQVGKHALQKSMLSFAREIFHSEGGRGFYRGLSATLLQAVPMNAIYFGAYEFLKRAGEEHLPQQYETGVHLCAGAGGELFASFFYVPFDVIKTRMQLGSNPSAHSDGLFKASTNYTGTIDAFVSIIRREGFLGLYSGFRSCIVLDCAFSALQFAVYEQIKKLVVDSHRTRTLTDDQFLGTGALAGGHSLRTWKRAKHVHTTVFFFLIQ